MSNCYKKLKNAIVVDKDAVVVNVGDWSDTEPRSYTDRTQSTIELIEKIEKLTKQLDIAVKCLKHYADENFYLFPTYRNGHEQAEKALEQIKELEK